MAASPFEVLRVHNDRENYRLTSLQWARNLDAGRADIERRFGSETWRTFRLYLWGCVDAFERDMVQAYRWVLRLPAV